jgi:hypothetical protein
MNRQTTWHDLQTDMEISSLPSIGSKVEGMVRDEKGQINFGEKIFLKSTAVLEIPPEG